MKRLVPKAHIDAISAFRTALLVVRDEAAAAHDAATAAATKDQAAKHGLSEARIRRVFDVDMTKKADTSSPSALRDAQIADAIRDAQIKGRAVVEERVVQAHVPHPPLKMKKQDLRAAAVPNTVTP